MKILADLYQAGIHKVATVGLGRLDLSRNKF